MDGQSLSRRFDPGALPPADVFFPQNVQQYRRYGSKARGECPFCSSPNRGRSRSTPLSLDLSKSLFHCFRCGAGGDMVQFVMLRDDCDFITAAKTLGALRPLDPVEAEACRRDREAKQVRRRRKDDEFYDTVKLLLQEMEIYESVWNWAFRKRHDELGNLAEQLINSVGADFILTKADYAD